MFFNSDQMVRFPNTDRKEQPEVFQTVFELIQHTLVRSPQVFDRRKFSIESSKLINPYCVRTLTSPLNGRFECQLHRCWWQILVTVYVGDNFEIYYWRPIKKVTNKMTVKRDRKVILYMGENFLGNNHFKWWLKLFRDLTQLNVQFGVNYFRFLTLLICCVQLQYIFVSFLKA